MIIIVTMSVMFCINFALLIYNIIRTNKINKRYKEFMSKLGNGDNIEESLKKYLQDVINTEEEVQNLKKYTKEIEKGMEKCIQKVGMVRYNAYNHTGSDLCFAIALLDFEDNGFVINGVYSRDNTTNTYAKPIEHGASKYTLVKEEIEAIDKAKQSGYRYFMNVENKEP